MNLLWVSINCRHEGHDDLADELLDRTDDDEPWFFYYFLASITGKPKKRALLCLVMAIILMV